MDKKNKIELGDSLVLKTSLKEEEPDKLKSEGIDDKVQKISPKPSAFSEPHRVTDGVYGWVVVMASFFNCFVVGLMFISFSLLYIEFSEHFQTEKGYTGIIGSMYLATGNLLSVVLSLILQYFGCRTLAILGSLFWTCGFLASAFVERVSLLFITYGFVAGLGFSAVTLSSFVIVQQHFSKHRSLAAGLSAAGISVGSMSSGPLIGFFIRTFGWRGCLIMMGGLSLNCLVFSTFYRSPEMIKKPQINNELKDINNQNKKKSKLNIIITKVIKDLSDFSLFRNKSFIAVCISTFAFNFGASIFYQHTPSRAVSYGISKQLSYYITTIIGIVTLVARILGAVVGNLSCTDRVFQYGFSVLIGGFSFFFTGPAHSYSAICSMAGCCGFSAGLTMTIQTTVSSDVVGVARVHKAQAFLLLFMGLGALFGVPLAGKIYDKTKNYDLPFYFAGIVSMVGGVVMIMVHIATKIVNRQSVNISH